MTVFVLVCAALLLVAALFCLWPGAGRRLSAADQRAANLAWYRLRQAELAGEGDEALKEDVRLRLLEDEQQGKAGNAASDIEPEAPGGRFPRWPLLLFLVLFSSGAYYLLGSAPDVMIARQLQSLGESSTPDDMQALMESVQRRSAQRPDNLAYVALLGRYYMGEEDYARAAAVYSELATAAPGDAQALAYAAQAEYLARGRQLTTQAQMWAEQALAIDPAQRTALGLLGMASFEQRQYRGAIEYWERLMATEPPGSQGAQMIASVIQSARAALGEAPAAPHSLPAPADQDASTASATAAPGAGVTVRVSFPEDADYAPSDTVFVLARNALSDSRMPVAVQRLSAEQLPVTLRLDDSLSMAGQKLSELESVMVLVQVSPDGRPGDAGATWLGSIGPLAPSLDGAPREIVLAPRG